MGSWRGGSGWLEAGFKVEGVGGWGRGSGWRVEVGGGLRNIVLLTHDLSLLWFWHDQLRDSSGVFVYLSLMLVNAAVVGSGGVYLSRFYFLIVIMFGCP